MYAYFKGILAEKEENHIVVEANGIGMNIIVSPSTLLELPSIGETVKIYTHTSVREDAFVLYGFLSKEDLSIFKQLIGVNGIGPRGGQSILSVMGSDELRMAIFSGDAKKIAKAPGIGPKTAQRIVLELKDKISFEEAFAPMVDDNQPEFYSSSANCKEAIEALCALGYGTSEATKAVSLVDGATQMTTDQILKAALRTIL